jgi:hypothetical protein
MKTKALYFVPAPALLMKKASIRRKLWITLTVAVFFVAAWMPKPASATQFGMNYQPYIPNVLNVNFLTNTNWAANKDLVQQDLNMMNSMGLTCQRLMFFADAWEMPCQFGTPGCQPPSFAPEWDEITNNLKEYIDMCGQRGISVDICFVAPYLLSKDKDSSMYDWQWGYGNSDAGWNNFIRDTGIYITKVVEGAKRSSYHDAWVKWYDIKNEISTSNDVFYNRYPQYLIAIYSHPWIPGGKIGFSILHVENIPNGKNDFQHLAHGDNNDLWLSPYPGYVNATKLTDSHCYPHANPQATPALLYRYQQGLANFPNSTGIVGEWAYPYVMPSPPPGGTPYPPSNEQIQKTKELDIIKACEDAGVPYAMHWRWIDRWWPQPDNGLSGWFQNHEINQPNDIVGSVGEKLSRFTTGDMETGPINGDPTGWTSGGQLDSHVRIGGGGATNNSYYHLTSHSVGTIWALSPRVTVPTCSKIYVNAYTRSTHISNISITVHQYDQFNHDTMTTSPGFTPPSGVWQWYSFQHRVQDGINGGGWICPARNDTVAVRVSVNGGIVNASPSILDVDTVTLSVR